MTKTGAIKHSTEALRLDPDNTKALFRRGSAYLGKGDSSSARIDFLRVEKKDPTLVKTQMQRLSQIEKKESKQSDKLYKKMFSA